MKHYTVIPIVVISIIIVITSCSETTTEPKPTVAAPEFHPSGGTYITPQEVTISCETEGAVIRYTADNSEPSASSAEYTEPIIITEPTTISAKAFKEGWETSEVAKAEYIIDLEAQVHSLDFEAFPDSVVLDRMYKLTVEVSDKKDEPVSDGILIEFDTNLGYFIDNNNGTILTSSAGIAKQNNSGFAYTIDGKAEISWNSGTEAGEVTFNVSAGEIKSNINSYITPGPPAQIKLSTHYKEDDDFVDLPEDIIPEDSYEIWIRAEILDSFGNHTGAGAVQAKSEEAKVPPLFTKTDEIGVYLLNIKDYQIGNNIIEVYANGLSNEIGFEIELVDVSDILVLVHEFVSINQTITIIASVENASGVAVRDGALVMFSTNKGYFEEQEEGTPPDIYTTNGIARIRWNSGTISGPAVIEARVKDLTDSEETYIQPGGPARIKMRGILRDPRDGTEEPIPAKGVSIHETKDVRIIAHITDKYDNPVDDGIVIRFDTDIGAITGMTSTNNEGTATARFFIDDTTGRATITASTLDEQTKGLYLLDIYE